ncbi:alpha/beta fold hydrolase [Streptomyces sp. NPDC052225]|uniref:alpha/beta fold hydrolase n=1 Tax=Streptomyces sp. NPDC052225 TaxID=3154949 RepID=UPI00343313D1
MTVFILVPGVFTGAAVWDATAGELAAAGAKVHVVDPASGSGVDLETHIGQVVEAIDAAGSAADRDVVLVGHDYGAHPVLGAADRRAPRIARIVYVDSALPRDGDPALAGVPDQELRERLTAEGPDGADLPVPATAGEWQRWGSTAGVPDAARDRLTALGSPQPLGTLLQPLRLTGAAAEIPSTGVLCAENGSTLAMVRIVVSLGDPALQVLTRPGVTFFELPTGHWPMLSCPAQLADVLLRAAAGEGERLTPPESEEEPQLPAYQRPFLLDVPDVPRERTGNVDLYLPEDTDAEGPRPAIVFVHGGPVPEGVTPTPRDWETLRGYGRYAAGHGVVGATLDHRLHDVTDYPRSAADVAEAVERIRADPRVDADRVALWFLSGGGLLTAEWISARPGWLCCLAACYPIMAPMPNWGLPPGRFRPVEAVAGAGPDAPPFVLLRAGLEAPAIAATVAGFVTAAESAGAPVEIIDVPNGHHGFEGLDPTEETRRAVRSAVARVLDRLGARPA